MVWVSSVVVYDLVNDLEGLEKEPPADFSEQVEGEDCTETHHCPSEDVEGETEFRVVGDEIHDFGSLRVWDHWFYTIESRNYYL